MSRNPNKVYEIGDKVSVALISTHALTDVTFLGVDHNGLFVFESSNSSSPTNFCVPKSSIIFIEVKNS